MFTGLVAPRVRRRPHGDWTFEDNKITGIAATTKGEVRLILPHGLTDEQRDVILWAYESGRFSGYQEGTRDLQRELCKLIGAAQQ